MFRSSKSQVTFSEPFSDFENDPQIGMKLNIIVLKGLFKNYEVIIQFTLTEFNTEANDKGKRSYDFKNRRPIY